MSKILIWDLEVTHLDADWGVCLCVGYKWLDDPEVHVISVLNYGKRYKDLLLEDKPLWKDFLKVYNQADMTITFFGTGFDRPYMYAKLLEHSLEIPANTPMVDLFYTAKSNLKLSRKSLANVSAYLNLNAEKTPVNSKEWRQARLGDKDALQYIIDHCRADVLLTEELYYKLRPLVRTHPRVGDVDACRHCGSTKMQRRGYAMTTLLGRRQRWQCQNCSAWDTRSIKHSENTEALAAS